MEGGWEGERERERDEIFGIVIVAGKLTVMESPMAPITLMSAGVNSLTVIIILKQTSLYILHTDIFNLDNMDVHHIMLHCST